MALPGFPAVAKAVPNGQEPGTIGRLTSFSRLSRARQYHGFTICSGRPMGGACHWLSQCHPRACHWLSQRPPCPGHRIWPGGRKAASQSGRDAVADTWDLTSLFHNDAAWEDALCAWEKQGERFAAFRGRWPKARTGWRSAWISTPGGSRWGAVGHVRHVEGGRGPGQQPLSADGEPLYPGSQSHRPGIELHSRRKFWPCRRSKWTAFSTIRPWRRTGCG